MTTNPFPRRRALILVRRIRRMVKRAHFPRSSASPLLVPPGGWKPGTRIAPGGAGSGSLRFLHARPRLAAIAVVVLALAVAVAWLSGRDASSVPPSGAQAPVIRAGLKLAPVPGWKISGAIPAVPGLSFTDAIALEGPSSGMRLVAGVLPATSPTMIPAALLERLRAPLGRPSTVQLEQGFKAYYYPRLAVNGLAAPLDVYVIPTTSGIATVACGADGDGPEPYYDCWRNVATLRLLDGRALPLGADAAFRQRLPAAIATLNAVRRDARRELASRIPARQARGASRVAAAYDGAATSLRAVAPQSSQWARRIVARLRAVGEAFREVVGPLRRTDAAAYARGSARAHAREQRLERLLGRPDSN